MLIKSIFNKMLAKKQKGNAIIFFLFSAISMFTIVGLAVDTGITLSARYEFQKALESAALATIADYEAYEDAATHKIRYPAEDKITNATTGLAVLNINSYIKSNSFLAMATSSTAPVITFANSTNANPAQQAIENQQNIQSRAIQIDMNTVIKTYFLNLIGIRRFDLHASAAAMHTPLYLKSGNILPEGAGGAYEDTDIRDPLGSASSTLPYGTYSSVLPAITNVNNSFSNISGLPDGRALSLGPGGYITIRLPAPIVDGRGFDLQIIERGDAAEGYFVFAGNDIDPDDPYFNAANTGGGISWVNISCTGTPINTLTNSTAVAAARGIGAYIQNIVGLGNQTKFYGSGYFDLRATCSDGYNATLNSAKYLKIIDDNVEDGFIVTDPEVSANIDALPAFTAGEHSSSTPGVDIDSIAIEHHPRLISSIEFTADSDGDSLIDVFEKVVGLNPNGSSDGSANDDSKEFWGVNSLGGSVVGDTVGTNGLRVGVPGSAFHQPQMIISYP